MTHVTIPDVPTDVSFTLTASTTGPLAFPFSYFTTADVRVAVNDIELASDQFTVSPLVTREQGFEGGFVTFTTARGPGSVRVWRDVASSRTTDFPNAGPISIQSLNTFLDRIFAILQQLRTRIGRSLRLPTSEAGSLVALPQKALRAERTLMFDADGQPTIGPKTSEIANAQGWSVAALTAKLEAEAAAELATLIASKIPNPTLADVGKWVRVSPTGAFEISTISASGDVVGPAGATANALVVFSGTSGKLLAEIAAGAAGRPLLAGASGAPPAFGLMSGTQLEDNSVPLSKLDGGPAGSIPYGNGVDSPVTWGPPPSAGETVTGQNVGTGGLGIFVEKINGVFRMRNVNGTKSGARPAAQFGGTVVMRDIDISVAPAGSTNEALMITITPVWVEVDRVQQGSGGDGGA